MTYIEMKEIMLKKGNICDHCLGRQLTHAFKGVENDQIGASLRIAEKDEDMTTLVKENHVTLTYADCYVCEGIFTKLDDIESRILEKAKEVEWNSFLVGNKTPDKAIENEERLWTETGMEFCEPIKRELNRVLGKRIAIVTDKEAEFENPEVILTANFKTMRAEMRVAPLFIKGKYKKLIRGIPQTKWPCGKCRGIGCDNCNFTGKMYQESVEEIIAFEILKATEGKATKFHGKGREDIDALMLGTGREFVLEIENPKIRSLDLNGLQEDVNKYAKGKVEAQLMAYSTKKEVVDMKAATPDKVYEALVEGEITDEDLKKLEETFKDKELDQQTPQRVAHRRADLNRKRTVFSVECEKIDDKSFKVKIRAQSGTYIKELISGDKERTKPSFTSILNKSLVCKELNVIEIVDGE